MTTEYAIVAAVIAAAFAWLGWQFWTAPEGWEDEDGFHFGRNKDDQ